MDVGKTPSIRNLSILVLSLEVSGKALCKKSHSILSSILRVRVRTADVSFSQTFQQRLEDTYHISTEKAMNTKLQTLIFVDNLYTLESTVFNVDRIDIPDVWGDYTSHVNYYVKSTQVNCDFCAVKGNTAFDTFGMMESTHSYVVSNAFKIQKFHGLAIPKNHHALLWTQVEFLDLVNSALRWFKRVHQVSPEDVYRVIYWDLLLKAGVSQMHPHMHLITSDLSYPGKWSDFHKFSMEFSLDHSGANYWTTLLQVHTWLGLTSSFGNASLIAYLTPHCENEVIIIGDAPTLDFFRLVYFALRAFIDILHEPSVSMGGVFPKMYADTRYGDEMPMLFQICTRGDPVSLQSDFVAANLFGTPSVNKDPYRIIAAVRTMVKQKSKENFEFSGWNL